MERGSSKHGRLVDEEMAREAQSQTRGRPGGSRAQEWREPEPAGEDQPEPEAIPAGPRPGGAPEPLTGEELAARSNFGRWVTRSVLPADKADLVQMAHREAAPTEVLAELERLPEGRTYETVYEIWDALGHRNEPLSSTGPSEAGQSSEAAGHTGAGQPGAAEGPGRGER